MQPAGEKFSQLYIAKGPPVADSVRFRKRLAALFSDFTAQVNVSYTQLIQRELGVTVAYNGGWRFDLFFASAELRDVLDTITLVWKTLGYRQAEWVNEIRRTLREENIGFAVDDRGGVHFSVDAEFHRARTVAISTLGAPRYAAARALFERAYSDLDGVPPDTRNSIRHMFDANENVFKLTAQGRATRLDPSEASKRLRSWTSGSYNGASAAAADQSIEGFTKWVAAAYQYRHAENAETLEAPPVDLTVLLLSQGAAFLRWLVEIDQRVNGTPPASADVT